MNYYFSFDVAHTFFIDFTLTFNKHNISHASTRNELAASHAQSSDKFSNMVEISKK